MITGNENLSQHDILAVLERNKILEEQVEKLKGHIEWLKRQMFGQKSERYIPTNPDQTELDLGVNPIPPEVEEETVGPYTRKKVKTDKPGHGRDELPEHLERKTEYIKADFDTTGMMRMPDKVTEYLEYTPGYFWVRQVIREVWASTGPCSEICCPQLPARAVDKGKLGASVLSQLIVEKCLFHIPLQRLSKKWKLETGYRLSESTLYDNFAASCGWLRIIEREILKKIVSSGYVQMDESTLRVLIKANKGKGKKGYMWVTLSPDNKLVVFTYRKSRNGNGPAEILGEEFRGVLQSDGFSGYGPFCKNSKQVEPGGCFAHSRRKFDEAKGNDKARAEKGLDFCQHVFAIERQAMDEKLTHEQRLALRLKKTKPVLDELKTWLIQTVKDTLPESRIGKAARYMLNQWPVLMIILKYGHVEISTNLVEGVIRLLAIGRKNFMFAGSENGARNLATAYTIIATCKNLDINPYVYITHVLTELPNRQQNDIEDLLPWNYKSHGANIEPASTV
jgi:transposase